MKGIKGTEMISKHKDGYDVLTGTSRKRRYYAHAKTLIQALMKRDYGIANNWKPYPYTHISKTSELYIHNSNGRFMILKEINKKMEYFGTFDTMEDAIAERDLLIKCNWDYDVMESIDEGDSWIDNDKLMKSSYSDESHYDTYYNWRGKNGEYYKGNY